MWVTLRHSLGPLTSSRLLFSAILQATAIPPSRCSNNGRRHNNRCNRLHTDRCHILIIRTRFRILRVILLPKTISNRTLSCSNLLFSHIKVTLAPWLYHLRRYHLRGITIPIKCPLTSEARVSRPLQLISRLRHRCNKTGTLMVGTGQAVKMVADTTLRRKGVTQDVQHKMLENGAADRSEGSWPPGEIPWHDLRAACQTRRGKITRSVRRVVHPSLDRRHLLARRSSDPFAIWSRVIHKDRESLESVQRDNQNTDRALKRGIELEGRTEILP